MYLIFAILYVVYIGYEGLKIYNYKNNTNILYGSKILFVLEFLYLTFIISLLFRGGIQSLVSIALLYMTFFYNKQGKGYFNDSVISLVILSIGFINYIM